MRNSFIPVIAAVVLFSIGVLMIRPAVDRGQGGPMVDSGLLGLPKRDPLRTASQPLAGSTAAHLSGARDDGRWRVVVISAADREPMTRAVMLALGETLFTAGCVVVMDPLREADVPAPPLPLPADRVIRVATTSAAGTGDLAGKWTASVELALWQPRLPADHPAAGWQPPADAAPVRCLVEHHGQPAGAGTWPTRWAATGRAIAGAAYAELVPPGGIHLPGTAPPDWGSTLPMAPQADVVRWDACFQFDLVRGWTGTIHGRSIPAKDGGAEPALAPLTRLLGQGRWQEEGGSDGWTTWRRAKDGMMERFSIRPADNGWRTAMWIERPAAADLVRGWIAAARGGDAAAKARLARAAATPALAQDLRDQAAAQR